MKNNKIISILSAISVMAASFINVPVFAEDTPIINSEQISFNFNVNGGQENGKFATVSYRPKNQSFPGFTSYSGSPLAYEWGVFSGSKLVFDISGLGDNVEFIDRVTLTPNGYVRDYIKSFNTAEEAAGFDAYYEQVNGETTVYRPISYTLKTMLVDSTPYPDTTLADMKYEEIKNEDNTKTFVNTMLNETENTVWPDSPYYQEPLGTMTYNYTDEQINYFKAGNLKKSLFDFGSVDITENIIPKILNGDETAAYTLWLDPDEYNICISVEPRSYTVDVSYITESKFLEKLTTSDNTAAYLDFVLSDSEMELYNGLSAESQSEVLAEVKSTGYGSMNEFTAAVKSAVNAKIDKELLAEIKAAMGKEDKSELDAYIIQALGKDDNLYQKFKLINDKETAAYSKIAAAESYEAFVSIVRTAIKEYSESAEKSEIDNYTYTLTNSWTNPENTHLKYNTNNGTVAYGNGSGIVGYNWGKEGARLTFNTEFISHPEMIKSAVVRLKTVTRDYTVKDRDVRLYLVPLDDNNSDADAFNGTIEDKFYSDDYGVYGDEAAPNNGKTVVLNMDVTDDIKEKLSSGKTDVSYIIASTSDDWSLGTLWLDERYATITMTVTYYNDYDFGRNHTDNVKAAIGYACGFDYESMYDALADKTAVDIRAKADYDTIASFKETIVPMVKEAYFEQIIKNGVTDEVIKNVFGVYSTEYDKYRSIIDKAQAVEGMEYSDYESFKTAASEAIANYLNTPSVRDTVSKQSAYEINQKDTQYVYQYIDGEAVLDDEGNRKSISDSILGYGLADKFINQASAKLRFENLDEQFAYKAYVKKAVLEYTAWTGSGDIGKNAVNAAVAMKKTVSDDSEPVSDYMSGAEYIYKSELVWNTAKTTADFPVMADITEDFKAASNLYYIVTPKRLCDENYVNFRFRQNPKITVTYMNSYDLYNEYKNSTDSTKKAEIIDVYAFVNDFTLTENSADIVSTLNNAETFEQFEQIIKNYRPLDVILGEVAAVEAGGMSVTVKNNTNKDMPVFVIAAAYGTNNKLLTTRVFSNESGTVSTIAANAEENFSFSFADVEGVKNVRVFCWTDFNTIKPYCPSSDYSIE